MTYHIAYFSVLPGGPADGYQVYVVNGGKGRLDVGPRHATPAAAAAFADALDAAETAHTAAETAQDARNTPSGTSGHPDTAPAARTGAQSSTAALPSEPSVPLSAQVARVSTDAHPPATAAAHPATSRAPSLGL